MKSLSKGKAEKEIKAQTARTSYLYTLTRAYLEREYVRKKRRPSDIAEEIGCSDSTVHAYIKGYDLSQNRTSTEYTLHDLRQRLKDIDNEIERLSEEREPIANKIMGLELRQASNQTRIKPEVGKDVFRSEDDAHKHTLKGIANKATQRKE